MSDISNYIVLSIVFLILGYIAYDTYKIKMKPTNEKYNPDKYKNELKFIDKFFESINEVLSSLVGVIFLLLKWIAYLLFAVGYIYNFIALSEHWGDPLTIGNLAEFVGVIIFPLGILTGWIYIL